MTSFLIPVQQFRQSRSLTSCTHSFMRSEILCPHATENRLCCEECLFFFFQEYPTFEIFERFWPYERILYPDYLPLPHKKGNIWCVCEECRKKRYSTPTEE